MHLPVCDTKHAKINAFWGHDLADFDALIKQALKTQNSVDLRVREKVYQSSRNALLRMLEKAGNLETPAGKLHLAELEKSIGRIEAEFSPSPVEPTEPSGLNDSVLTPPSLLVDSQSAATSAQDENVQIRPQGDINVGVHAEVPIVESPHVEASIQSPHVVSAASVDAHQSDVPQVNTPLFEEPTAPEAYPEAYTDATNHVQPIDTYLQQPSDYQQADYQQGEIPPNDPEPVLNYKRKSPILRRLSGLLMILIVLGVIAWLAYAFMSNLSKPTNGAAQLKIQEQQRIDKSSIYLDILTPSDHSALVTAGRGTVEVVTELNTQYLRIQSIRKSPNSATSAEPILLELQPGVLKKIAGKSVTVEIITKSGNSDDGLFSVQCLVGGKSVCDRKRFPVGQQPENIIFALNLAKEAIHGDTFLAINTDVKSNVNASGAGSPIDILYVRIRIPK